MANKGVIKEIRNVMNELIGRKSKLFWFLQLIAFSVSLGGGILPIESIDKVSLQLYALCVIWINVRAKND